MHAHGPGPPEGRLRLRSLLFVPGDRPERFDRAAASGADAVIIDLEDAVEAGHKEAARAHAAAFAQRAQRRCRLLVRVNPLHGPYAADDLAAIGAARPDGIVLPKADGSAAIRDACAQLPAGMRVLPIVSETPGAVFHLGEYVNHAAQLLGLTWGVEDLSAAIGARSARRSDGSYTPPFEMLRGQVLFAAHAAGVAAIETVYTALRDPDGLRRQAIDAARDGFSGMLALHPDQVPVINAAFTATPEEVAAAHRIVAAFRARPGSGVVNLDGVMLDAPHLQSALRLIEQTETGGENHDDR